MTTEETRGQPGDLLDCDPQDLVEVGPDGVERLFGKTLEEIKALQQPATPDLLAWADGVVAEHTARPGE